MIVPLVAVMLLCACRGAESGTAMRQDTVGVLRAALVWADTFAAPRPGVPIVLFDEPRVWRPAAPDLFGGRPETTPPTDLPLAFVRNVAGIDRRILVCVPEKNVRSAQLCGTRPPWLIVLLSVPHIQGDSAVIQADLIDVVAEYDGGAGFVLLIERTSAGWSVIARQSWGVYD